MSTVVINIRTNQDVKTKAQKIASEMGLSLSALINSYLSQVIRTKTTVISATEGPTKYMLDSLKESSEDIKAGRVISFKDLDQELDFLDKMIDDDKNISS